MSYLTEKPLPPSQRNPYISKVLDDVILRSLARDPQARFPSASAMTVALVEAFEVPVPDQVRQAALSAQGRAGGRVGNPSSQRALPLRHPRCGRNTALFGPVGNEYGDACSSGLETGAWMPISSTVESLPLSAAQVRTPYAAICAHRGRGRAGRGR